MSVHKHKNGYKVTWREGKRQRARLFPRGAKDAADLFDREVKTHKALGKDLSALVARGGGDDDGMTLAQFVAGPWKGHALRRGLSRNSQAKYAWALEKHLGELLDTPLTELTVPALAEHQELMLDPPAKARKEGRKPATASTVGEVFMYLGAVLQVAVERGDMPQGNPAYGLSKVKQHVRREKDALTPVELERLLDLTTGRDRAIALLGGRLGLRPYEIVRAPWEQLVDGELRISAVDTKPNAPEYRAVKVDGDTLAQLRAWQLESGGRGKDPIVGPNPGPKRGAYGGAGYRWTGHPLTDNGLKLWGTKQLRPLVEQATHGRITKASTNTLRHSHASALHYAGFTLADAADRMGHSQETHVRHYSHMLRYTARADGLDALYAQAQAEVAQPWRAAR